MRPRPGSRTSTTLLAPPGASPGAEFSSPGADSSSPISRTHSATCSTISWSDTRSTHATLYERPSRASHSPRATFATSAATSGAYAKLSARDPPVARSGDTTTGPRTSTHWTHIWYRHRRYVPSRGPMTSGSRIASHGTGTRSSSLTSLSSSLTSSSLSFSLSLSSLSSSLSSLHVAASSLELELRSGASSPLLVARPSIPLVDAILAKISSHRSL